MLIIKRYTSYLLGILTFVGLEFFILFPNKYIYIGLPYFILLILALWYLQIGKIKNLVKKITFFILPIFFVVNFVAFLIYFNFDRFYLHLAVLFSSLCIWLYVEGFVLKKYFTSFFRPRSWEYIIEQVIIISAFLFYVNIYNFRVYNDMTYGWALFVAVIGLFFLNASHLVFNDFIKKRNFIFYLILVPFLSLEFLLVTFFLPTNLYSISLINTLFFYIFIFFSHHHLREEISAKIVYKYLLMSMSVLFLILLISNWT